MTSEIVDPYFLLNYAIGLLDRMGLDASYCHLTATAVVTAVTLLLAWGFYSFLTRVVVKYVV